MLTETETRLETARVLEIDGARLRLTTGDAILALPWYRPVPGDIVVVVFDGASRFVIGVTDARGEIDLHAPVIRLRAGRLEVTAQRVVEKFADAYRWVRGLFQVRAKRERHVVEEDYRVGAERIVERAKRDVKIDGEKINLG